jgi:hypothetical protein
MRSLRCASFPPAMFRCYGIADGMPAFLKKLQYDQLLANKVKHAILFLTLQLLTLQF